MKKGFFLLVFIFLLAISFRLGAVFATRDIIYHGDAMYLLFARNISDGKFHVDFGGFGNGYWFQPGYPMAIAFFNFFIHDFVISSQLISVIAGGLVIFPLFYLAKKIFGLETAYLCAGLIVLYPALNIISTKILTESLFTVLFITSIYLGYIALEGNKKYFFFSGIIIGFSFLVKEVGLFTGIMLSGCIGIRALKNRKEISSLLLLILGIFIVISPWLIYLRRETGQWILVPKTGYNLCLYYKFKGAILNKLATGFAITEESKDISLFGLINEQPFRVMKHFFVNFWKVYHEILPGLVPFFLIGFLFLGFLDSTKRFFKTSLYILSFFIPFFVLYPLVAVYDNYFTPLLPLAVLWMARGISFLKEHIVSFGKKSVPLTFYFIIFLFVFLTFGVELKLEIGNIRRADNGWSKANRDVGLWLKQHKDKRKPRIISRTPHAVFFAEGEYIFLPQENLERILEFARYIKADYIILDKSFKDIYPKLQSLFISTPYPLKLLYRYATANQEFLIFSL